MQTRADAKTLDAVMIKSSPTSKWRNAIEAAVPDTLRTLDSFLKMVNPGDYDDLLEMLKTKSAFFVNDTGAAFSGDTVTITALDDTLIVPAVAFERLAARMLHAGVAGAEKMGHPATRSPEWKTIAVAAREYAASRGVK